MGALAALVLPKLSGSTAKLIAIAVFLAVLVIVAAYGQRQIDDARYERREAQIAQEKVDALNAAIGQKQAWDTISTAAGQKQAAEQQANAAQLRDQLSEVSGHVIVKTVASGCVPYGLVRVLDAAASGRGAALLSLPAGKSDDACAPVTWAAVARSVVDNYYTARANIDQLNGLIGAINDMARVKP